MDADVEEFFASQKRARARSFVQGMKMLLVMSVSTAFAIGAGFLVARWDHQTKVDRLDRYRHGEVVMVRDNENVTSTAPSPKLPVIVGIGVGVVIFALGAALVLKDKTYLGALGVGPRI
jgi:hypothetical protein